MIGKIKWVRYPMWAGRSRHEGFTEEGPTYSMRRERNPLRWEVSVHVSESFRTLAEAKAWCEQQESKHE